MANCVLCGKELGRLEAVKIEFHGTQQLLCDDCHIRFVRCADGDRLAMEEKMLASPDLAQRETVLANASARKSCPVCGAPMECKLQNFSIGADGGGGLATLLALSTVWIYMPVPSAARWSCTRPAIPGRRARPAAPPTGASTAESRGISGSAPSVPGV